MRNFFRYTGRVDPERCVASVHHDSRFSGSQCQNKRKKGSEWCGTHEPKVAAEDAPQIWVVDDWDKPKLAVAKILKETKKQLQIQYEGSGLPFHCRSRIGIQKNGKLEIGARDPVTAAGDYMQACEKEVADAERYLEKAKKRAAAAKKLMDETYNAHQEQRD